MKDRRLSKTRMGNKPDYLFLSYVEIILCTSNNHHVKKIYRTFSIRHNSAKVDAARNRYVHVNLYIYTIYTQHLFFILAKKKNSDITMAQVTHGLLKYIIIFHILIFVIGDWENKKSNDFISTFRLSLPTSRLLLML